MHKECQMKKFLLGILLLISSFFIMPSSLSVNAESTTQLLDISTVYPKEVEDYHDLSEISHMSADDNYIAYTLNNIDIIVYQKVNKKTFTISGFTGIKDIKLVCHNQLIVIDNATLKYIDLDISEPIVQSFGQINLDGLNFIDIYESNNTIYIGLIRNSNLFELYTIKNEDKLKDPSLLHSKSRDFYNNSISLAINDREQYVVDSSNKILICAHDSDSIGVQKETISQIKTLKYIETNDSEYLLAFTGENMYILPENEYSKADNNYFSLQNMQIQSFTDVDISKNNIYICDSISKSIRNYNIETNSNAQPNTNPYTLNSKLWLASSDKSSGRFNNVSNIFLQGNRNIVSDTKNNRIQIIEDGKDSIIIDDVSENEYTNPHGVVLDRNQNVYFVVDNVNASNTSSILKFSYNKGTNEYSNNQTYSSVNGQNNLGKVSDTTIDDKNIIYIIDYSNNQLVSLSQTGLQSKCDFNSLAITTKSTSKIEYIIKLNMLALLNDGNIYLLDISNPQEITCVSNVNVGNCVDISTDLENIYILSNNTFKYISIEKTDSTTTMQISEKSLSDTVFSNISTFNYDLTYSKIVAFRKDTQSLIKIDCDLTETPFNYPAFDLSSSLSNTQMPIAINITSNGIIYDYPYYKGNYYQDKTVCIGIGTEGDYYRVLFEDNNTLKCGFIHGDYVSIHSENSTYYSNTTRVITTDQQVPVYKYPTLLKTNGVAVITQMLPTQTTLSVSSKPFPIQIDGKQFYLFRHDNAIGFLFNANIVEDNDKHIVYLHTENATINAIGESEINIYAEDKETIVKTINNLDRVYVDTFDKNSEYTKVVFKDIDNNITYEGYIRTKFIDMDKLDNSKIVLILIIVFSVVILGIIATSYIVIKKKR